MTRPSPGGAPDPGGSGTGPPAASTPLPAGCLEAIAHLRGAIQAGTPWPEALLGAMGLWTLPQELRRGRVYRYLLLDEAFDWLLLARRLAEEVDGLIPAGDRRARLATGRFVQEVSEEEVQRLLGDSKYRAYLNYWYGVTVEGALQEVVRHEVRKERASRGLPQRAYTADEVSRRIYGEPLHTLLASFAAHQGLPDPSRVLPRERKGFTYWLFLERLRRSEPTRVASDTRKALEWIVQRDGAVVPGSPTTSSGPRRQVPTGAHW